MTIDITSCCILVYCGLSLAVMLFVIVRHHWRRHALRKQECAIVSAQPELGKRPPSKVVLFSQESNRRRDVQ